ncbi:MAG: DNA primase [Chloroflexi bacterium]|nr:DNA primase [Chloroflexota bacterium]
MSAIDDVKQRADIVSVVGQYTSLAKAGRMLRGLCPFHSEKTPSFFVYPERQSWHCFGACSAGGDVFSFVMKKENLDFAGALRLLAERLGVTLPSRIERDPEKEKKDRAYRINEAAARYFHVQLLNSPAAEKARQYLARRGVSPDTIARFQLGFSPDSWESLKQHLVEVGYAENEAVEAGVIIAGENGRTHDRFRGKLMFPIADDRGHVTGFGARVLDDSLPKYVNSPQSAIFDKSGSLYGINLAAPAIRQQEAAIIVEGYMDVIIAHQYGFGNVIASMGTAITDRQVNILKKLSRNLALALDSDSAGEEAMLRCVAHENLLESELKVVLLPEGKDPDEVIKEDAGVWTRLVGQAKPVIDYTFDMVSSRLDMTSAMGKSAAADRLLPIVAGIKDPVRQAHYLAKLAALVKVDQKRLQAEMRRAKGPDKSGVGKQESRAGGTKTALSNPREEYCLALLLRYPDLKESRDSGQSLLPEYFANSENREVFLALLHCSDVPSLKERLDESMWEHIDSIAGRDIPPAQIEQKYCDCVLLLQREFLRSLAGKRAETLALEKEQGGRAAEAARQQEHGLEIEEQLREVFTPRTQRR